MNEPTSTPLPELSGASRLCALAFSASVLMDLARKGHSPTISAILREQPTGIMPRSATYADIFESCHALMWSGYRSEYVYKNAIARRILLGRHSLQNTRFLTEFRVADCKADVVLINGTSTCYEIKTELDDFERLARQLEAYRRVFDRIYVVTFSGSVQRLSRHLEPDIGILELTEKYRFATKRPAISNRANVDPLTIFDSMRRSEYTRVLRDATIPIPNVPNTQIYGECRRLFSRLSPEAAHDGMVRALRQRTIPSEVLHLAETSVPSITAAILGAPLSASDARRLTRALTQALQ